MVGVMAAPAAAAQPAAKSTKTDTKSANLEMIAMDGNEAAATVAYQFSDVSFIYPITPSSTMGELVDAWSAAGRKNMYGQVLQVTEMESEAGAAGALHGALAVGAQASTYTASQGLLLMIPNMYKIAGEQMPCVMHVAARALAGQALSIFGDHSDVMAVRQTGWALLSSHSVQEAMDMALVAHISSIKASLPIVHFFDGFRTSHEVQKIESLDWEKVKELVPWELVQRHRDRALNPSHPHQRGTSQAPDIFFQLNEASNVAHAKVPGIIQETMEAVSKLTGREYNLVDYYGHAQADRIIVIMGAGAPICEEVVDFLINTKKEKVGVLKIRLYRPWPAEAFLAALPKKATKIAVLDRCKDQGAHGEPLYMDVCSTLMEAAERSPRTVVGGRWGLGSKDFTPGQVLGVFANLKAKAPKNHFTVGINDDVTFTSLPPHEELSTVPVGTTQAQFWGMGSDGTVGANKEAIKIIANNTDLYTQAYFSYDAHKSGGVTISHLRFGPTPIKASYLVQDADYIGIHHPSYLLKYDFIKSLKPGGTLVLNVPFEPEEFEEKAPPHFKRAIAKLQPKLYLINALAIGRETGLGKRINMVMQTAFFHLASVIPSEQALALLKGSIAKAYGKKGQEVVDMNCNAVDLTVGSLKEYPIPTAWADIPAKGNIRKLPGAPDFVNNVMIPMMDLKGDDLPVSAFVETGMVGGRFPAGTTQFEKRAIASKVPVWQADKCSQCNYCSFVCPHAAIRPALATQEEIDGGAPEFFEHRKAKGGAETAGFEFSIQVSPFDCTGCELCAHACPDDALVITDINEVLEPMADSWDWFRKEVPNRGANFDRHTVKGSQFQQPLMEFSGACEGCGETPYVKLLTQLFGDRMVVANATGCSSIWGGSAPANPYTTNADGRGPAWANSLFEDNAQFGFGIALGLLHRRDALTATVKEVLAEDSGVAMGAELRENLAAWLEAKDEHVKAGALAKEVERYLSAEYKNDAKLKAIWDSKDLLVKVSPWIVGGDGWAYDIGYGGLDHVLASGENVNVVVLDTEMYSNTGGQKSKSTPLGAVVQFAAGGKRRQKKDLGLIAMQYGDIYVASVCLGANFSQVVRAFTEAEAYDGPSIILAYAPCIMHGLKEGMSGAIEESKLAVDSGYWTLYRYNPTLDEDDDHCKFQLDSRRVKVELQAFLKRENRFGILARKNPHVAGVLQASLDEFIHKKHDKYVQLAETAHEHRHALMKQFSNLEGHMSSSGMDQATVLYGSETGNAEGLAHHLASEMRGRGVDMVRCMPCDDFDPDELPTAGWLIVVISTAGQGEFPENSKSFWEAISSHDLHDKDWLKDLKFAVFGLGDSSYCHFCKAAKEVDDRLIALGGQRVIERGVGDDQDEDKYETGWGEWVPDFWATTGLPAPPEETGIPPEHYSLTVSPGAAGSVPIDVDGFYKTEPVAVEPGTLIITQTSSTRMTPMDYDRDIRHIEFDLPEGFKYGVGDALAIYPRNDVEQVVNFLKWYDPELKPESLVDLKTLNMESSVTKVKPSLPKGTTVMQLFTDVLDIFGRPSRRFYEGLKRFATDPAEIAELTTLINRDEAGKKAYGDLVEETVTFYDMLKRFPSAKPPIVHLVDLIPTNKCRYYSIASSQRKVGAGKMELCVVIVDWTTPTGRERFGLTTNYLRQLNNGSYPVRVALKPSAGLCMPPKSDKPIIMAGLGTGLAPFRSMAQEREYQLKAGREVGPTALFFGCRKKAQDYLYGPEWEAYLEDGTLTDVHIAFSRDQAQKIYVQHKIEENADIIWDYLAKRNGYFFFCGPARRAPQDIRAAIEKAFQTAGHLTAAQAVEKVDELMMSGHYVVEAWS